VISIGDIYDKDVNFLFGSGGFIRASAHTSATTTER
jgi:hypothetical protein